MVVELKLYMGEWSSSRNTGIDDAGTGYRTGGVRDHSPSSILRERERVEAFLVEGNS